MANIVPLSFSCILEFINQDVLILISCFFENERSILVVNEGMEQKFSLC